MTNQVNQQPKPNPKGKAVVSLLLGIISGISVITIIIVIELLSRFGGLPMVMPLAEFVFYRMAPLIAIIGLILGILGLKSTKRNFAIAGIILCLIGLLTPLYYFLK
jgi:hypothetical protein